MDCFAAGLGWKKNGLGPVSWFCTPHPGYRYSVHGGELHGSGKAKNCFFCNDLLLYNSRSAFKINDTTIVQTSRETVPAVDRRTRRRRSGVKSGFLKFAIKILLGKFGLIMQRV